MAFTKTRHNAQPAGQIPSGHTRETAAELTGTGVQTSKVFTLIIAASTVQNNNQTTALDAIYDAVETKVTDDILEGAAADDGLGLKAEDTTDVRIVITSAIRKPSAYSVGDYQNQYKVSVDQFEVKFYIQYKVTALAA